MLLSAPRDIGCTDLRQTQSSNDKSAANHIYNYENFNVNRNKQQLNELFRSRTETPEDLDYVALLFAFVTRLLSLCQREFYRCLLKKCKFKQY